jgi:hypothetical protein
MSSDKHLLSFAQHAILSAPSCIKIDTDSKPVHV